MSSYILDTSIVSDLRPNRHSLVAQRLDDHQDTAILLSEPVIFEVERGFLYRQATHQLAYFQTQVLPRFSVVAVESNDWQLAARLWADTRRRGVQLSDIDLLLASMALRLGAILVTDNADFEALPVPQVNWRR